MKKSIVKVNYCGRVIGTTGDFSAMLRKEDDFCYFFFFCFHAHQVSSRKKGLLLKERICTHGAGWGWGILSFYSRRLFRREAKSNLTVALPKCVIFLLISPKCGIRPVLVLTLCPNIRLYESIFTTLRVPFFFFFFFFFFFMSLHDLKNSISWKKKYTCRPIFVFKIMPYSLCISTKQKCKSY